MGSKTLCLPLVGGKTANHNQNFRSAERVNNVLKGIGLHHSLLSATDEIQQDQNRGIASTTRLSEPPTDATEEGLLTILSKPDNLARKNNE